MNQLKRLGFPDLRQKCTWQRLCWYMVLALVSTMAVTMFIFGLHLYPRIHTISLLYLLVVLTLASTRGRFAAICASLVAFLSFDYFLVPPIYTFTIAQPEEWLALGIFLCTAIITGQLASAWRSRAQQARQREQEMRILYELVRDTTKEEDLDHQLGVIARTLVEVFASRGVRDCAILLPDERRRLTPSVSVKQPVEQLHLRHDEVTTAAWVLREGKAVDLYEIVRERRPSSIHAHHVVVRSTAGTQSTRNYLSLFPLKTNQRVVGILRLQVEDDPRFFGREKAVGSETDRSDPNSAFFWTFLDQAASMIEHARLRRESVRIEILQRTDALRASLVSSISHDLRTPLTSIKAAASSLLQDDVQWNDEARQSFAQAIEREADRLNRLVGNLLDMSRIEGGALQLEKEWYPLDEVLHDVLEHMQPLLKGRQISLDLPAELPPVEVDYLLLDQVLTNLIENALRYTPARSPITIAVSTTTTNMTISVADQGPGIPVSDLERIFDKFYRVQGRTSHTTGSGLGLAVCRGLVEAHGGHIWATNRSGGGAIFHFTLPLAPLAEAAER
jgi:two-component system sensor histidine kinase KdpD